MSSEKEKPALDEAQKTAPSQEQPPVESAEQPSAAEMAEAAGEEGVSIEELTQRLEEVSQQAEENWDKFVRTQAEMENLRRRTEKDLENAHKYALERFVKELLPVIDSLELGVQAASSEGAEVEKLREGSELTLKLFQAVLEKFNVAVVDPLGEAFDPERHQAMSMEESAEAEPNTVLKVFQKGYVLNGRLLRPAMVVVAKAAPQEPQIEEQA